MTEFVHVYATGKADVYEEILPQIKGLIDGEKDLTANLANVAAVLKMAFAQISWVGFYLLKEDQLVLGPFQGKPACVRISPGKGVCGTSFERRTTMIVPDVENFPGHIVCDPDSRSEIVVPIISGRYCIGVLDVDSASLDNFNPTDQRYLQDIVTMLLPSFGR